MDNISIDITVNSTPRGAAQTNTRSKLNSKLDANFITSYEVKDMLSGVRFYVPTVWKLTSKNYIHPLYCEEYSFLAAKFKDLYTRANGFYWRENVPLDSERLLLCAILAKLATKQSVDFTHFASLHLDAKFFTNLTFLAKFIETADEIMYASEYMLARLPRLRVTTEDATTSSPKPFNSNQIIVWIDVVRDVLFEFVKAKDVQASDELLTKMLAARSNWQAMTTKRNKYPIPFINYVNTFLPDKLKPTPTDAADYAEFWGKSGRELYEIYANQPMHVQAAAFITFCELIGTLDGGIDSPNAFTSYTIAYLKEKARAWMARVPRFKSIWVDAHFNFAPNQMLKDFLADASTGDLDIYDMDVLPAKTAQKLAENSSTFADMLSHDNTADEIAAVYDSMFTNLVKPKKVKAKSWAKNIVPLVSAQEISAAENSLKLLQSLLQKRSV